MPETLSIPTALAQLETLRFQAVTAVFVLALALGYGLQRSQFCTMGAISDMVLFGDSARLRQWVLAMGIGVLGFAMLVYFLGLDASATQYASARWKWLSASLGGLAFGFGMVLASGCSSRNLVRIGGGSGKALAVVAVMGLAAYSALAGPLAAWRTATLDAVFIDVSAPGTLAAWVAGRWGLELRSAVLLCALLIGSLMSAWALRHPAVRSARELRTAVGLGAAVVLMWWIAGCWAWVAEHPETLETVYLLSPGRNKIEALSFVAPVAQWWEAGWGLLHGHVPTAKASLLLVLGTVLGAALAAWRMGIWRWEWFASRADAARHMVGAVLMGWGGVTAGGCTVGQGLSGISTLGWGSMTALAGILLGGALGVKLQEWMLAHHD